MKEDYFFKGMVLYSLGWSMAHFDLNFEGILFVLFFVLSGCGYLIHVVYGELDKLRDNLRCDYKEEEKG